MTRNDFLMAQSKRLSASVATMLSLLWAIPTSAQVASQPSQGPGAGGATVRAPTVYMVRYRPGPSYRPGVPLLKQDLRAHGAYIAELVGRGIIIAAGPTMVEAGGLVLLRARDLEDARAAMEADPAVRSGIFTGELSDWRPLFDPAGRFGPELLSR